MGGILFPSIPKQRWRRTGMFNLSLIFLCGVVLLVCLAVSLSQGSTLYSTTVVFEGDCQRTDRLNLVFHLILNLISTLTLASAGFFMQLLSSPSRQEIDRAHSNLRSLDIGVSSIKNVRFLSPGKSLAWFILFVTSIPIHMFFNSSIFKARYQGSDWRLTIASSGFGSQGVQFFPPGASLANAGVPAPGLSDPRLNRSSCSFGLGIDSLYGSYVDLAEYWNKSSSVYRNITNTAIESKYWHNMTPNACREEYGSCKPKNKYRDVIIVIDTDTDNPNGWTRSQVFSDPHNDLAPLWDSHVPLNDVNSLWYSTHCTNYLPTAVISFDAYTLACGNTCRFALGISGSDLRSNTVFSSPNWTISLPNHYIPPSCLTAKQQRLGYNNTFDVHNVKYCLAQPSTYTCQIRLSNILLFTTMICVLLKTVICILVVYYLPQESLATLGDALESFITNPDSTTTGLGTFDIYDSQRLQFGTRAHLGPDYSAEHTESIVPRVWHRKARRLVSALPKSTLSSTYVPILSFGGIGGYYACQIYIDNDSSFKGAFGKSDSPYFIGDYVGRYGFLTTLIFANIPQFILSYCFFSYSSIFTRFLAEKEFNSYSLTPHKPLRVSYPVGEQISTYWLQLPYTHSLPLLVTSTLLHWFATNSIFISVSQGGYLKNFYYDASNQNDEWGLPKDAVAVLAFSPPAILTFFIACIVIVLIPILYGLKKLPGDMIVGACDSLVLSAACHPHKSTTCLRRRESNEDDDFEDDESENTNGQRPPQELSKGKLLWGVSPLPSSIPAIHNTGQEAMHLSFCSENKYLHGPVDGQQYA
ncbi:hypothetical protein F4806DRAFT_503919 [Annulohypoxylon nitens]|nr:hypothetical protein F4806DRAFT_503919 [Annulohypoxylon nitens]